MKKKALLLLALAGCRTPAELGPRLPPISRSRDLVDRLASRAAGVKGLYVRGVMRHFGLHPRVEIALGSGGNGRLMASLPVVNKKIADVLVADGEIWAYLPTEKKLYRGKTDDPLPEGKVGRIIGVVVFLLQGKAEGVLSEAKGRPGLPPGAGGKWLFFPDLSRASEEQMSVSRRRRHYDVTITREGRPARSLNVSAWSRIPEEVTIYDLDEPGEVLAVLRYTSFSLEGKKLMPRALHIRLPGLKAAGAIKIEKLDLDAKFKPRTWRKPRVRKGTEVIELKPGGKDE